MPIPTLDTLLRQEWPILALLCVLMLVALFQFRPSERRNVLLTVVFFAIGLGGLWLAGKLSELGIEHGGSILREVALVSLGMIVIRLWGLSLFRLILPAASLDLPRILEDLVVFVGYVVWGMIRLRQAGVEIGSLVTTSAVITAVAAFSMQDTLGNILSGVALQLDDSLELGQWVKASDVSGKVLQIGWRSTLIETRNGETIVIPNAWLMKNSFQIIGKRFHGHGLQWRRWVWFELSWDLPPAKVIEVLQVAARDAGIATVAVEPAPQAVLMEVKNGIARYALRYWLTDFARDDPTDSQVRAHVMIALMRNNLPLAADSHNIWMTKDNEKTALARHEHALGQRIEAIKQVSLFADFKEEELHQLADRLVFAPFEAGDIVSRQGAVAHWLYILTQGEVDIWHDYDKTERQLLGHLSG
ncbi:MAG: mechanosensitive ion channel, partial [Burkholderiales bacterium]|nr:mechanosensitive ion channel [Burkholderiales bacterium]